jgi:hypothetical protein
MPFVQLQLRRGTAAEWGASTNKLLSGELGYETDTNKLKVGDGLNFWSVLPYVNKGDVGPSGGPSGPSGASGLKGDTGNTGASGPPGSGWSGGYIRVKFNTNSTFATSAGDRDVTNAGSGRSWNFPDSTTAVLTITSASTIPPTAFGYIAWHVGSSQYKAVNLPYGSPNVDYPRVLISKGVGVWTVTITITTSSTFPGASNDSDGYAYYIYL